MSRPNDDATEVFGPGRDFDGKPVMDWLSNLSFTLAMAFVAWCVLVGLCVTVYWVCTWLSGGK